MSYAKIDPTYYEENQQFLKFLQQLAMWRDNHNKNTEMLIESLCELYVNHYENDELFNKIKIIIQVMYTE